MLSRFLESTPFPLYSSDHMVDSSFIFILQEKAYSYQDVDLERHGNCPVPSGVLTPPLSSEKTEDLVRMGSADLKIRPMMHNGL